MSGTTLRTLLADCVRGAETACSNFFMQLQPLFRRIGGRIAAQYSASDETDDIVQEIHLKIASRMTHIADALPDSDTMVQPYLACVAANAARDYFRRSKRERAAVPLDDGIRQVEDRGGFRTNLERGLLFDQIEEVIQNEGRNRTLFRLYYRQGLSAAEIASIPAFGLSTKGVEAAVQRLSRRIRDHLRGTGKIVRPS